MANKKRLTTFTVMAGIGLFAYAACAVARKAARKVKCTEEKVVAACEKASQRLGVSPEYFMRLVYDIMQERYDQEDVENWLDEEGYAWTKEDVDKILTELRDDYDCEIGTWRNIERAYWQSNLDLTYQGAEDDEDDEEDDEDEDEDEE